jgi:CheY-like chemotaxis protein
MIFMDLQMPEMNGFEATEYIRKKLNSDVPIIALTADVTTADLDKCKAAGMNDYISKPVDDKLLYKKIMKYINSSDQPKTNDGIINKKSDNAKSKPHKYTNFDYLKELTVGKPEGISIMIKAYLEETPKLIQTMKRGIETKDWPSVGAAAHSIIPSFSMVGISPEYEEIARKIQEYSTKKNPESHAEEIKTLFTKIENVCSLAMEELKQEF